MHNVLLISILCCSTIFAQSKERLKEIQRGSQTAKGGFKNEDDIRDKFNAWKSDKDAQAWLTAMKYELSQIQSVKAVKPHGYKADVEVRIRTDKKETVQGISIKLVSSPNGFNQIDKRWLKTYARMWKMPDDVVDAMKFYLGETPPIGNTKRPNRMYLTELPEQSRDAVIAFFRKHKDQIISDLLAGDGEHAAKWFMVTLKSKTGPPRWTIRSLKETIRFYSEGKVVMTRAGNLKLGRISMQRKGGDNGRPTANMLQFKMNPVQLFGLRPKKQDKKATARNSKSNSSAP
ncbi:MAG: type II restriction endonuclease [Planctomycetaceae bacterium]